MRKTFALLPCVLCLVFLLPACSDGLPPEFPAPDFNLKDVFGGNAVTYSEYKGRPFIVYFFASW